MSNYLIDQMTWSHSRISSYLTCPYQFFLKYIEMEEEDPMFLAQYGSFVHEILARYYSGEFSRADALDYYLTQFRSSVQGKPPSMTVFENYYTQGLDCVKRLSPLVDSGIEVLDVEHRFDFQIDGYPFVGIVDLMYRDSEGSLCIMDHKSRTLKKPSSRQKPTKTDIELAFYTRQLYLYSVPVAENYRKNPDFLTFNCYRSGEVIKQKFRFDAFEEAKQWALGAIHKIEEEKDWRPDLSWWRCKYLCGFGRSCEYAQMAGDRY